MILRTCGARGTERPVERENQFVADRDVVVFGTFRLCLSLPSHMKLLCKDFTFYAIDLSRVVVADSRLE